ncbi:SDR family NAD(P)-dependent oxidoreductase [Anaerobacillus sp. 1_MG-2023]|uniref:SDR family NAD(P)-dependent oxidoreductase n=1 Tax=Bacillales TaxID=1385 RepID=UPI0026E3D649|nr:SDR family NAD(P)-dependent oxidoreductase [Anaerobacillus sp. 1_MG-2023]MDO6654396.1 SDR family NAD(P)-dependent oxidoreductase [Anaerobacillus sp. 1_MG-2023]
MKILITGATDGIGLATARKLISEGHEVLLHGRNAKKLANVTNGFEMNDSEQYVADLSQLSQVKKLAREIIEKHDWLDVLINNAGVYHSPTPTNEAGLDIRFAVNTLAPYLLTKELLPLMNESSRVINLSSAAQAPVDAKALAGSKNLRAGEAYAQSKLALTMWTFELAKQVAPVLVAVNPKSLLGSKMVKKAFGVDGEDINIGAEILCQAALSEEFKDASGKYFDNDIEEFGEPHPDAQDQNKCADLVQQLDVIIAKYTQ